MKGLLAFYGILMGCSMFFGLLEWLKLGLWPSLFDDLIFTALVLGFLALRWGKVSRVFRLRKPKVRRVLELTILCVIVFFFLKFYFSAIEHFGWPILKMTEDYKKAHWPLWAIFGIICVQPGIFEEIAFRGILQTQLSRILSVKEALFIQAALFSILHLSPLIFVSHFVMGLLLGWVRFRTGTVYWGMLLHMSWNAYVVAQELGFLK